MPVFEKIAVQVGCVAYTTSCAELRQRKKLGGVMLYNENAVLTIPVIHKSMMNARRKFCKKQVSC